MQKRLQQKTQGFTIIEVMIVLVIAAVILLIVFLAIPALQRNSRNTQRKDDAARVVTLYREYLGNNPTTPPTNTSTFVSNVIGGENLAIYEKNSEVTFSPSSPNTSSQTALHVRSGFKCAEDDSTSATDWQPGSGKQFIVVVWLETATGRTPFCVEG